MSSILRREADWGAVITAAQREGGDEESWAHGVAHAATGLFTTMRGPAVTVLEHSASCDSARYAGAAAADGAFAILQKGLPDGGLQMLGVAGLRTFYYPPSVASTFLELEQAAGSDTRARGADFRRRYDVQDAVGVFTYPEPGIVVTLFALHDRAIALSRYDRRLLTRMAMHLEASYRLRRRPESLKAILDADGHVLERASDAPSAEVLTAHASRIDRARRLRDGELALSLWPALVSGRFSLVERRAGTKRRYVLIENAARSQPFRALSPAEVEVVSQAARGHSTKLIAYALGVSSSVVSEHLASAAAKVGASSRIELVRLAAMLTRDPRARFPEIALTGAEREVLELLQQGLSNEQIAKIRSRSVRTIANQVASLLRKTNTATRRELLVLPPTTVTRGGA